MCGSYGCRTVFKVDQPGIYLMHCLAMHTTGKLSSQSIICLVERHNPPLVTGHCGSTMEVAEFPSHLRAVHDFCVPSSQQMRDMKVETGKRSRAGEGIAHTKKTKKAVTSTTVVSAQPQQRLSLPQVSQQLPVVRFQRVLQSSTQPQPSMTLQRSQVLQPPWAFQFQPVLRLQQEWQPQQPALSPLSLLSLQSQGSRGGLFPVQLALSSKTVSVPQSPSAVRSSAVCSETKQPEIRICHTQHKTAETSVQVAQQSAGDRQSFLLLGQGIRCGSLNCFHEYETIDKCLSHMSSEHVTAMEGYELCLVDISDSEFCRARLDEETKDGHLRHHINDAKNKRKKMQLS